MSDAELARLSRPGDAIDAVIFDMDGVLADSEPLHQHAIRVLLAEYDIDWAPDGRDPTVGLTSLESFAVICARHTLPHDPRRLDELYTARVLPLLRERVTPLPGVPDVLRTLVARGLRLGLASSSGPEVIETTLATLGVRPLFEVVVSGVEVARGKPAPFVMHGSEPCPERNSDSDPGNVSNTHIASFTKSESGSVERACSKSRRHRKRPAATRVFGR